MKSKLIFLSLILELSLFLGCSSNPRNLASVPFDSLGLPEVDDVWTPSTSSYWSGPQTSMIRENGQPYLVINGSKIVPIFLAVTTSNNPAVQDYEWGPNGRTEYQLNLAQLNEVLLVEVTLDQSVILDEDSTVAQSYLNTIAVNFKRMNFNGYLIFRIDLYPESNPRQLGMNLAGLTQPHPDDGSMTDQWIQNRVLYVQQAMKFLDKKFPGKIIGIKPSYGEWMGSAFQKNALHNWEDPDGVGSYFNSPSHYYFGDYSSNFQTLFCNWRFLPTVLQSGCRVPGLASRINANLGNSFITAKTTESARAIKYNRFYAERTVQAMNAISNEIKSVSQGKAISANFYGYLFETAPIVSLNGHGALAQLLSESSIDWVTSPYSYMHNAGADFRNLGHSMAGHGPLDSPALHGKTWIVEDDTRTHLCLPPPYSLAAFGMKTANSLADSKALIRRNGLTAGLHGLGLYYYDLPLGGWFGHPSSPNDSTQIWQEIKNVRNTVSKIQYNTKYNYHPEIAVFVDDLSFDYSPLLGLGGKGVNSLDFSNQLFSNAIDALTKTGAPVRQYLLSDLLLPNFPADKIKMAVFLNAFAVPTNIRQAIQSKLENGNRMLVYQYAPGLIDASTQKLYSPDNGINTLTHIKVNRISGGGIPSSTYSNSNLFRLSGSFGPSYLIDPLYQIADTRVATLATYASGGVSAALLDMVSYKVVLSATTGMKSDFYRSLAKSAGVHIFSDNPSDIIEASGNTLMVHSSAAGIRNLAFPYIAQKIVRDDSISQAPTVCSNCNKIPSFTMNAKSVLVFRAEGTITPIASP